MGYVRLQEYDDWGRKYLALPGHGLRGEFRTADARLGLVFINGQRIHVKWPDNSQSVETIVHKAHRSTVGDTGGVYSVEYLRPGVETETNGVTHWVSLADLFVLEEDLPKLRAQEGP